MLKKLSVVCLSGSLRKNSCNTGILRYAISVAPADSTFELFDLHSVPMYDGDLDPTETRTSSPAKEWPASVKQLREKVEQADVVLVSVSENNANVSPVLINAISWTSRPEKVIRGGAEVTISPIIGKKVGIVSGAGGLGGQNAQDKLRNMSYLKWTPLDLEEGPLKINLFAPGNFDFTTGDIISESVKENVKKFVGNLVQRANL